MDVMNAVLTAKGEFLMITSDATEQAVESATGTAEEPKSTRKANTAPRKSRAATGKGKTAKKSTPTKKHSKKAQKAASAEHEGVREGSKTAKVLGLLQRSDGATLKEIIKATGWQPHSIRGFISGTLGKKMALTVNSAKGEDGERRYTLAK
jgi:hypothetical protein